MELFNLINQHCDIRLLKTSCNFKGCYKKPKKEMLIIQLDMNTVKRKEIISLYLCDEHYTEMEKILGDVVGKFVNGKVYKIKKSDI